MAKKWTSEEVERLAKLYKARRSLDYIARMLNDEFHEGKDVRNVNKVSYGVRLARNSGFLHKDFGKSWTDDELICLECLYRKHMINSEIASALNKRFHRGVKLRNEDSISYGINLVFSKGLDAVQGVKE